MAKGKPSKPAKKTGRPALSPEEQQRQLVTSMASFGIPEADIAKVVGCDPKTLRKHFRAELDTAHTKANAQIAQMLFKKAMGGNVTALIFWAKTRLGWSEKNALEISGPGGGPIRSMVALDKLNDEQLEQYAKLRRAMESGGGSNGGGG